jgi:hypothetical protein
MFILLLLPICALVLTVSKGYPNVTDAKPDTAPGINFLMESSININIAYLNKLRIKKLIISSFFNENLNYYLYNLFYYLIINVF